MKGTPLPRWLSWAGFAGAAMLFLMYWRWMALGSIFIACDVDAGEAAFAACDRSIGTLQAAIGWAGLPAFGLAALGEWKWRWSGSILFAAAGCLLWLLPWMILK